MNNYPITMSTMYNEGPPGYLVSCDTMYVPLLLWKQNPKSYTTNMHVHDPHVLLQGWLQYIRIVKNAIYVLPSFDEITFEFKVILF